MYAYSEGRVAIEMLQSTRFVWFSDVSSLRVKSGKCAMFLGFVINFVYLDTGPVFYLLILTPVQQCRKVGGRYLSFQTCSEW